MISHKNIDYIWDITTGYSTLSGKYKTFVQFNFIKDCLDDKKNLNILDIGGGSGRFALPLSKNHSVMVIDPNKEALSILRQRDKTMKLRLINKTFEEYDLQEKFDFILLIETMQYFANIREILKKVYIMLNDDGSVIFSILNKTSIKYLLRKFKPHTNYPDIRSYRGYKKIIHETGFKILNVEGYNWIPFKVNSNCFFVNVFTWLEFRMYLRNIPHLSPELMFWIKKR